MAALVIAALFWGNCFSCPQMLLASRYGHECCHHPQPAKAKCDSHALQAFEKSDAAPAAAPVSVIVADPIPPPVLTASSEPAPAPGLHVPPDLFSLHSTFRI
jgi:hypothetical protein